MDILIDQFEVQQTGRFWAISTHTFPPSYLRALFLFFPFSLRAKPLVLTGLTAAPFLSPLWALCYLLTPPAARYARPTSFLKLWFSLGLYLLRRPR